VGRIATPIDEADYPQSPQKFSGGVLMRAGSLLIAATLVQTGVAYAADPMAPNDIKATFFDGKPFNAASPTGTKFTMTFTADGKITRHALAPLGKINVGIWKLNAKGFCTSWEHAGSNCFIVVPSGDNKWLVQRTATTITTTIAVWSK
jgi:hypothetical protein